MASLVCQLLYPGCRCPRGQTNLLTTSYGFLVDDVVDILNGCVACVWWYQIQGFFFLCR
jgi:hypothetical protein